MLAGGASSRLGGTDKPALEVGGTSLLERAVGALADARDVVVVGPKRRHLPGVRWTREQPPGFGPVAALAAGMDVLAAEGDDLVAILAADLAGVTRATVHRLARSIGTHDGAVLVDQRGKRQWLLGIWRAGPLRAALPDEPAGKSMRATVGGLSIVEVPGVPGEAVDVDTEADLRWVRSQFG